MIVLVCLWMVAFKLSLSIVWLTCLWIVFSILFLILHSIGLFIDLQWNKFMHRNERDAYYQNWADYFPWPLHFLPALNMVNNRILNLSVLAVIIVLESFSLVNKIDFGFHGRIYFFCPPENDIISRSVFPWVLNMSEDSWFLLWWSLRKVLNLFQL